ncbi:hypothetical protein CDD83_2239 [Cordyceps sp. RAO-2017]|nr:hypothetical protein CDD83_2239 [Cordyceps sp. RAO-2017]
MICGVAERRRERILLEFQTIVGSIVILQKPLTTFALAQILEVEKRVIDDRLDLLRTVIDVPSSSASPVRLFHLYFRNFLLDPDNRDSSPFWVDKELTHAALAANCLRVMMKHLRQDMCRVNVPAIKRSDINSDMIQAQLPLELQYACIHWVCPVHGPAGRADNYEQVYTFLKSHSLHWIESHSLLGHAYEGIHRVRDL